MNQKIDVNITPNSLTMPTLYFSQGDIGRVYLIEVVSSDGYDIPSGATVKIEATKPSGFGFSVTGTVTDNTVEIVSTAEMTDEAGRFFAKLEISSGGVVLGTANFCMSGQPDTHPEGTIDGSQETIIPQLTVMVERVENAAAAILNTTTEVETLPAGSQATYSFDEDTNTATFGIPQGEAGAGAAGVVANAYSASKTYAVGEYAIHNSNLYRCTTAITTAESFTASHWTQVVLGDDVTNLKNDLNDVSGSIDKINYLTGTPIEGYYNPYTGTGIGRNAEWSYYPMFEIEGGFYYIASYNLAHVAFYDDEKEYISGVLVDNTVSNFDFKAPDNAKYMTYSYKTSSGDQYVMRSTGQKAEYVDPIDKKLDKNTSLNWLHYLPILQLGKNLFNKYNLIEGYCLDYGNAERIWRNASWCFCPDYMPVKASTTYHYSNFCIIAEYDADLKCIATYNKTSGASTGTITTSANAKYIRIGARLDKVETLQFEEGDTGTLYQSFGYRLKHGKSDGSSAEPSVSMYSVKKDGTGDYRTISDAISNASNDDIIIVYPATYEESVHAYNKRVHIIGTDRAKCILTYSGLDYANPPLEMAKGSVRNLTIKATNTGTEGSHHAYCVHIDNDNEANEALSFTNVDFINEIHQAVGIGLRANFTLTFDDCRFKAEDQAGLYCHDWETSDETADKTGQKLIVRNCSIVNNSSSHASIMLQSQELVDEGAEATFIGNSIVNKGSGSLVSMTLWQGRTLTNDNFMGSSDWVLSKDSALNSTFLINADENNIVYTVPSVVASRANNVVGGYYKIDRIVYINLSFKAAANHTGTPGVLDAFPKPLGGTAVLNCMRATNGIKGTINDAIPCGVQNVNTSNTMYMKSITTGETYYVTGSYIAES